MLYVVIMTRPVHSDADRADAFRGLAHPLRRRLISMLGKGERPAGELQAGLNLSQPALSRHLRVLRDTGLVRHRVQGARRFYRVNTPALRKAQRWFQPIA
jgi:DNA-binding transcriptional ArsR family regulator